MQADNEEMNNAMMKSESKSIKGSSITSCVEASVAIFKSRLSLDYMHAMVVTVEQWQQWKRKQQNKCWKRQTSLFRHLAFLRLASFCNIKEFWLTSLIFSAICFCRRAKLLKYFWNRVLSKWHNVILHELERFRIPDLSQ